MIFCWSSVGAFLIFVQSRIALNKFHAIYILCMIVIVRDMYATKRETDEEVIHIATPIIFVFSQKISFYLGFHHIIVHSLGRV